MTAHAPVARVPFAPLDNPRLQHLNSTKNRQNGIISQQSSSAGKCTITKSVHSPGKRAFEASSFDDFDSENVDPAMFDSPPKKLKHKCDAFDKPVKPFTFNLTSSKTMPPPTTTPLRMSTPSKANMSLPRTPSTAPAGRSPVKRKIAGIGRSRRVSAPFTRIDPPFGTRGSSSLPFSLDAALSGSLTSAEPKSAGATIQESMPKAWFFDIYEDTPDEEAANLMEHSTLTLDLSSDDECSKKNRDDRGKENTPPEGYDAPTASRARAEVAVPRQIKKTDIIRKKLIVDEMDDGQRSPLSDLETDSFIPEGLSKDSHVVVDALPEKTKFDVQDLFPAPIQVSAEKTKLDIKDLFPVSAKKSTPAKNKKKDEEEIVIWQDDSAKEDSA